VIPAGHKALLCSLCDFDICGLCPRGPPDDADSYDSDDEPVPKAKAKAKAPAKKAADSDDSDD
jgi:hypothetical protein